MKIVNSISGGKTSAYMAIHHKADINIFACVCIDYPPATPKDSFVRRYAEEKLNGNFIASAERQKTLKVLIDLEQILGSEIVWVRGKSFDQIIDENSALPTWARRFCTTEMKLIPIFEYLFPRYGKTIHNIGFRADERERIKRGEEQRTIKYPNSCKNFGKKQQCWSEFDWQEKRFPLKATFHQDIRAYWSQVHPEVDFPWDSNCVGCHHKPKEVINRNYREDPEILDWFALQEDKKLKQGKTNYATWKDDGTRYKDIFGMHYEDLFSEVSDFTMCNSGGCTD
jgi:hypothetical protein